MRTLFSWRVLMGLVAICMLPNFSMAEEFIINGGGKVTVKTDGVLHLNCRAVNIKDGGTFSVEGGTVTKRGELAVKDGGIYQELSGDVDECGIFFFIPTSNGKGAVISL